MVKGKDLNTAMIKRALDVIKKLLEINLNKIDEIIKRNKRRFINVWWCVNMGHDYFSILETQDIVTFLKRNNTT